MAQYKWIWQPKNAPKASDAGKYLTRLAKRNGGNVSAKIFTEDSRSPNSIFHPCFTWDDHQAAEEYRLEEARRILRSLQVVVQESDDTEPVHVNAFVNLNEGPDYVTIQSVVADEEMDHRYKLILLEDLRSTKRKCEQYKEFREVCHAIESVQIS